MSEVNDKSEVAGDGEINQVIPFQSSEKSGRDVGHIESDEAGKSPRCLVNVAHISNLVWEDEFEGV